MRNRHDKNNGFNQLILEALERRDVPAVVLDYDLVAKNPADFSQKSLIVQLPDGAAPNYSVGAYAPGLKLVKSYPLVPGMYKAELSGQSLGKTLDALRNNNKVQLVQPDAKISNKMIPNDPSFSQLYGMNNTGQSGGAFDADIDAAEAWDKSTGTGQTIVAVIDTGVDYNHPDLRDNIWVNAGEIAGNGRDDDGNGYIDDVRGYDFANNDANPMDDNGHGTHVSGTIGAVGNNGIGVAGVNWRTKIMPVKFLAADGSGYLSAAIDGLNYAVANGARLSNNSWGGGGYDATLGRAIANAATTGHIFVAASGNDGQNNDVTASYPSGYNSNNIVAVAATDHLDNLAYFSNYGVTSVDIAAPGVSILSTLPSNQYGSYSGTSMATPHVTGALSLYWDANPTATYTQVISALYQNADKVSVLDGYVAGGRRLNVDKLLGGSAPVGPDTTGAKVTVGSFTQSGGLANGATITFSEAMDPASFTTADVSLSGPSGAMTVSSVLAVAGSGNTRFTVTFPALSAAGNYTLKVGPQVLDLAGNPMDQNGNGVNGETGDAYSADWVITPPPADITGAKVTGSKFNLTNGQATSVTLTFSEAIAGTSFATTDVALAGPAGSITATGVQEVSGTGGTQFTVTFPALSAVGTYTLSVGPQILDGAGNPMDQNGNQVNGEVADAFSTTWVVSPLPPGDLTGAKVTVGQFVVSNGLAVGARLTFSEAILAKTFTKDDLVLTGPNGVVNINSVSVVSGTGRTQFVISFPALKDFGTYTLRVGPAILDNANNSMDQNGDGVNGGANDTYAMDWVIKPPADVTGARIINGYFTLTSGLASGVTLKFSEPIDIATFTAEDVVISGPQGNYRADSVQAVDGSGNTLFEVKFKELSALGSYSVTVGPNVADRAGNLMDQNQDGLKGRQNDTYALSWQVGNGQTFTSNRQFAIGDMRMVMSTIFVDKDFKISDLNVRLNVSHTAVGDLNVVLLSPNFTPYVLMMGRGGNGDNLNGTLFDDQAAVSVANGVAPFSGSFKPESTLVALNGQGAKGGWTLVISDTLYGDKGELKNWSLEFNTVAPAANNLKRAIVRASVLGATVAGVAPIWKGGALLSIDSGAVSNPVASPPEAMPQTRALEASSIARNRMAGFLDQMIWSRLADELVGSRKK